MKIKRFLILAVVVIALFSIATHAQTRRPVKRTTPASKTSTLPPLDVRAARVKVSNQQSNVTQFVERLGPVAEALEALDAEAKTKTLKKETLEQQAKDKRTVVAAIRGVKEGLASLESEFRVKLALKKYLPMIQGISVLASQAENSALGGKFVAANASLRTVQQKLTATLTAMPDAEL